MINRNVSAGGDDDLLFFPCVGEHVFEEVSENKTTTLGGGVS